MGLGGLRRLTQEKVLFLALSSSRKMAGRTVSHGMSP